MSMSSFLWYDVSGSVAANKGRNRKKPLVHMTRGFLVIHTTHYSPSLYVVGLRVDGWLDDPSRE